MNTCWQPASALTLRQVPWRLSSEGLGLVNFHILQKQLSSWIIYDWEQLWLEALGIHKRSSLPSRLWDDVWKAIWISYKIGIQIKLYLCFSIFQLLIWKPENLNDCATYSLTWICVNFEGGKKHSLQTNIAAQALKGIISSDDTPFFISCQYSYKLEML